MEVDDYYDNGNYKDIIDYVLQINKNERNFNHHYYYIKSLNRLSNIEDTIKYAEAIIESVQQQDEINYLKMLYELIWAYHKQGNLVDAKEHFDEAFEILNKIEYSDLDNEKKQVVNSTINLGGIIYYSLGNLEAAMENFQQLLENADDIENPQIFLQGGLINTGLIYLDKGEYRKSIKHLNDGLELAESNENYPHMRVAVNNLAYTYTIIGDLGTAEEYARKTIEIANEIDDKWGRAMISSNVGFILLKKGDYDESLKELDQAYNLMKEFDNEEYISRILFLKLLIQLDTGNRFTANETLQEIKSYYERTENLRVELIYQLADAIYLRYSGLYKHKLKAEEKLKKLISSELDLESELISYAYLFLTELLLEQLSKIQSTVPGENQTLQDDEQDILKEIEQLSDRIMTLADEQQMPELKLQAHYINAQLAIVKLDTEMLSNHLNEAEKISQQWGFENVTIDEPNLSNLELSDDEDHDAINLMVSINNIIHSLPRLKIMIALSREQKLTFSELQDLVDLSSGNLSNHCKILVEKKIVHKSKELVDNKFQTIYSMTSHGIQSFRNYISKLKFALSL